MTYLQWFWHFFEVDREADTYLPWRKSICVMIMPCLPEWEENFQHAAGNDNRKV